ncbi:MAG: PLP-dependent transferase [Euryarchaeota archaeon]|nr:PLP-dependent transferase [Euryarchaeota archaeon]
MRFDTLAIHGGQGPDPQTGAVNVPVYLTSTYAQTAPGVTKGGYDYARTKHPTRDVLESSLAALEGGAGALAFSSGLGALTTLLWSLPKGSRVLACDDLYGGTYRLLEHARRTWGLETEYLDMTDATRVVARLRKGGMSMVYLETPTNPLLRLVDIDAVTEAASEVGATSVVDNTFATPYFQRPLELGADIVLHSTTKYLGGHSDVVGGALVFKDPERLERMRWLQNAAGAVPGPLDCYLVIRGIRTLGLRMRAHAQNALAVARALEEHPKVARVLYPGLPSHPQHDLARQQMSGHGGMVSAELKEGLEAAKRFLSRLRYFFLAESLGGVESLVEAPALMTHQSIPKAEREKRGLSDGLIRFSVGVEDPQDLVDDVLQALG